MTPNDERDYWSVTVTRDGESLVTIDSMMLSGKANLSEEELETIRQAARHLLGFAGNGDRDEFLEQDL